MTGYFNAKLFLDDYDATRLISNITIICNCNLLLPLLTLRLTSDPSLFTKPLSDYKIKLHLQTTLGKNRIIETKLDLTPIQSSDSFTQRNANDKDARFTPTILSFTSTYTNALQAASTLVNIAKTNTTIEDVLNEIASQAGVKLHLLTSINSQVYKQILIPPLSLNQALKYLQKHFGIVEGPLFKHINHTGQLLIGDIAKLTTSYPKPLVIFTRQFKEAYDRTLESGGMEDVNTEYENRYAFRSDPTVKDEISGKTIVNKANQTIICKPLNKLYSTIEYKISDIAKTAAVYDDSKVDFNIPSCLEASENIHSDVSIYMDDDIPISYKSKFGQTISTMTSVVGILEQFRNHLHFMYDPTTYGFSAIVKDASQATQRLSGKYALWSSKIVLTKEQEEHYSYQLTIMLKRSHV